MTSVDFYILSEQYPNTKEEFACRVADKAYRLGHNIYIHTESRDQATTLDDLLWTYKPGSFLPHELYTKNLPIDAPILVGFEDNPEVNFDVLVTLAESIPLFFSRFMRVAEIVSSNDPNRVQARERYRFYRDRGYPLNSHDIKV
jgi:DNA polymerase-3 subunit chi